MVHRSSFIGLFGALVPLVAGAQGAQTQVGNLQLRVPDGWQRIDRPEAVWLVPPGIPEGRTAGLMVFPSQPLARDMRTWSAGVWNDLMKTWRFERGSGFRPGRNAIGQETMTAEVWLVDATNPANRTYNFIGGIRNGRAVETYQFITNADEFRPRYEAQLRELLGSIQVAPSAAPVAAAPAAAAPGRSDLSSPSFSWGPVPPPRGNAGLDGLYRAFTAKRTFDASTYRTEVHPSNSYWVFFPDGRFYRALPEEGLESFNYDYWHERNPLWCGHYQFSGGSGQLVYDDDAHTTASIETSSGGLVVAGGGPYRRVDPCDGLVLEGTYRRADWQTLQPVSQGSFIAFTKNGRFEEDGALELASASWWRPGKPDLEAQRVRGGGTYTIGRYSLTLVYDDGRRWRINFHLADGATREKPDAFMMNTWTFVRVK